MKKLEGLQQYGFHEPAKQNIAYGTVKEFPFAIIFAPEKEQYTIITYANVADQENAVKEACQQLKEKDHVLLAGYDSNQVKLIIKNTKQLLASDLNDLMEQVADILKAHQGHVVCPHCHAEKPLQTYVAFDQYDMACADCTKQIVAYAQEESVSHLGKGILGALLGSLIGGAIWVLIYQLGYISMIGGIAMLLCTLQGYQWLGKTLDRKGLWISILIAIVMVLVAEGVALYVGLYFEAKDLMLELTFQETWELLQLAMEDYDFRNEVMAELAIGYIFLVAGTFYRVYYMHRELKAKKSTQVFEA